MQSEIQQLCVYYKGKLLIFKKDYNIVNREINFYKPIQRRYLKIGWEVINV